MSLRGWRNISISLIEPAFASYTRSMISTLNLEPLIRVGKKYDDGTFRSQRRFVDLLVNGVSLWEVLGKPHDMVSVLCSDFLESETVKALDRLLLKSPADLQNDRSSLFVCAECGDLGCGAISMSVKQENGRITWCDFGYENNYEARILRDEYSEVGPFEFEFHPYESALLGALERLKSL